MFVTIKPSKAELKHDVELIEKMDPYIVIEHNGKKYMTGISENGGKKPTFKENFSFQVGGDGSLKLTIMDKNTVFKDSIVASADLNLYQIAQNGQVDNWYPVYYEGEVAGQVWLDIAVSKPGSGPQLFLRPIRAELIHNTELLGKMDPFVRINYDGNIYDTSVCEEGGKTPQWTDVLTIPLIGDGSASLVVLDKDPTSNDFVGDAPINLLKLAKGGPQQSVEIFYKGKKAGVVYFNVQVAGY